MPQLRRVPSPTASPPRPSRWLPTTRPPGLWGPLIALSALTLGVALGSASRLTYHEAIVAQVAREMLARGDGLVPTLGGLPWPEKPPLLHWLVAALGWLAGGINEWTARLPSALAALLLAGGVGLLASRLYGRTVGRLAALVQTTCFWTVHHGRLAEADILLAAIITWAMAAFAALREKISRQGAKGRQDRRQGREGPHSWRLSWRPLAPWRETPFFALLGATALLKGIGFGAALLLTAVTTTLLWDRDRPTLRRLLSPAGWALAATIALAWPLAVALRHPESLAVWLTHITDRFAARPQQFASEPLAGYAIAPLGQVLPWTPLALAGAWRSWRRARLARYGPDRLLWAWAVAPAVLVSLASVRNAHYLIHALPPWSIWAALSLARLGDRLKARGWADARLRRAATALFAALGLAYALGFARLAPRLDRRGVEWAWYAEAGRHLEPGEPLVLLYDDWDRLPYPSPFGAVPHDLAVRLFYLDRPGITWHRDPETLLPPAERFACIARERDLPALQRLGRVEDLARGPAGRWDRAYRLLRITPAR